MGSALLQIKDGVQQFAEAMAAALKLDVEIVDDKLTRIAGTGKSKELIGQKMQPKGVINRFVLGGQKHILLENPGKDEKCSACPKYGNCYYKKAVYAAIDHEGTTIGVIGLAATEEKQAAIIQNNNYAMLKFIDKIAELISTKVKEFEMLKKINTYALLMNQVIENINKGIVVLDKDLNITDVNNFLLEKLEIPKENMKGRHINEIFGDLLIEQTEKNTNTNSYQEVTYSNKNEILYLLCTVKSILAGEDHAVESFICILEDYKDTREMAYMITERQDDIMLKDIIGSNVHFMEFKKKVKRVASYDSSVLLVGETGTGKELFARAIHTESQRSQEPFITINCGAIPESLIESELFGYEKGAFTGASNSGKHGKFYLADKGAIFLDEVETMPLYLQQKLLRVIENQVVERVGGEKSIPINVRIVAATNIRLDEMVEKGSFREDLFHRLNVVTLFIPPLRDRGNDVLVLAQHFIEKFSSKFNKRIIGLSEEVEEIFLNYPWDGNVRELQNTIEYAINMEQSNYINEENLPFQIREKKKPKIIQKLEDVEKQHIKKALDHFGWHEKGRIKAAEHLGVSRATIYRKINKYNLQN